jgi:hypothetical protein
MTELEQRYARVLTAYPKSYRQQRGKEILATLMEASPETRRRPPMRDVADIALHGIQMRLGLTSERFGGRVLNLAATPGLVIAAVFSVFFFVYAELFPFLHRSYGLTYAFTNGRYSIVSQPHFGAFSTTGVMIYLGWVGAAVGALARPPYRRMLASLGIGVTVVSIVVGKAFFAAPRVPLMLAIVMLAVPAALAPTTEYVRRRGSVSALCAGFLIVVLWWPSHNIIRGEATHENFQGHGFFSLYALSDYNLGDVALFVGAVTVATTLLLISIRRTAAAGAVALVALPWLILTYAFHVQSGYDIVGTTVVLALPMIWLLGAWIVDLMTPPRAQLAQTQPVT